MHVKGDEGGAEDEPPARRIAHHACRGARPRGGRSDAAAIRSVEHALRRHFSYLHARDRRDDAVIGLAATLAAALDPGRQHDGGERACAASRVSASVARVIVIGLSSTTRPILQPSLLSGIARDAVLGRARGRAPTASPAPRSSPSAGSRAPPDRACSTSRGSRHRRRRPTARGSAYMCLVTSYQRAPLPVAVPVTAQSTTPRSSAE